MEPALLTGMSVLLTDRDNCYPDFPNRISSLHEIPDLLKK